MIPYTANIMTFIEALMTVINFDIFSVQSILMAIFKLQPSSNYNEYNNVFTLLTYDNSCFVYLIGPPMALFFGYIAAIPIYFLFKASSSLHRQ